MNRKPVMGWIGIAILFGALFWCVLLILWLLPQAGTGDGALGLLAISFSAAVLGGLLSVWMMS